MANTIGWGQGAVNNAIGWGQGAVNNIGWGAYYSESWSGETDLMGYSLLAQRFSTRVLADGGTIENVACLNADPINDYNWAFYFRVIDDGGTVINLSCL